MLYFPTIIAVLEDFSVTIPVLLTVAFVLLTLEFVFELGKIHLQ